MAPPFLFNSLSVLGFLIHLNVDRVVQLLGQLADGYRAIWLDCYSRKTVGWDVRKSMPEG